MTQMRPKMLPTTAVSVEATELRKLQARVERLFTVLEEALEVEAADTLSSFTPTIDLYETDGALIVAVELPGVNSDEINLTVTAKDICIEGEKRHSRTTQKAISHFCCERQYGSFKRRINLRWAININKTTAELNDGTLIIRLPKLVDRRGKSVKIPIINRD